MGVELYNGDCLDVMKRLPDGIVDLVVCDLPYGTTAHGWDAVIPFEPLWEQYWRVAKDNAVFVLFATQPFTTTLIGSNIEQYRYSWVWKKDGCNGFLNANYAPLKITEDICVFSRATVGSLSKNKIRYNPQGVVLVNERMRNNPNSSYRKSQGYTSGGNKLNSDSEYCRKYSNYPNNILEFARDKDVVHPTQKPVALLKYLIRTYSNEGEIILDNTMGSGSTGVACVKCNRNFIGIELDKKYFDIANKRINESVTDKKRELF